MRYPWNLDFWKSGEWQAINERLHDMERMDVRYNPGRSDLFRSLTAVGGVNSVRAVLVGQDPYPQSKYATGLAFSIPPEFGRASFPPTLRELLAEYERDLGYGIPSNGDLSSWISEGVLLWNVIPSCQDGRSLSHDWSEYQYLNREIFGKLSERGVVFALLGGVARRYADCVKSPSRLLITSHPSPRGSMNSKTPFNGSRLFSTINKNLNELGLEPINWRLDASPSSKELQTSSMDGSRILPNITGVELGGLKGKIERNLHKSSFEL